MAFKRKTPSSFGLERRVRPRREDEWMEEPESQGSSSEDDDDDDEVEEESIRGSSDDDDDEDEEDQESGEGSGDESEVSSLTSLLENPLLTLPQPEENTPKIDLSSVSFGALAKAQASLPSSGHKSKSKKSTDGDAPKTETPAPRKSTKSKDDPKPKRSSKHAPQEQTSKKPVSRRREILPDNRRQYRDPRFDPLVGRVDEEKASKAYAFLDEYRDKEMADLRAQIKKTKDSYEKDNLKRQLQSMESRKKANMRRQEEERLLKEHRQKEKELVAQGKTPFYLKKSEQKKQLLVNRYEGMSKGQVDRAIERKRKKFAGKEKKELDFLQRGSRPRG
ncbi:kinase [Fusarium subglutinans]|uniref:rRNA biogenesis protein RRP36 n=1 Tax=Gibberella subglutinans TaxID=42677 RepID=A0A8H5V1A2_GIBSU|nr:kinase [Fusarium subglutinans]KAF5606871.1 kinase [Fusarium subglutinans]